MIDREIEIERAITKERNIKIDENEGGSPNRKPVDSKRETSGSIPFRPFPDPLRLECRDDALLPEFRQVLPAHRFLPGPTYYSRSRLLPPELPIAPAFAQICKYIFLLYSSRLIFF